MELALLLNVYGHVPVCARDDVVGDGARHGGTQLQGGQVAEARLVGLHIPLLQLTALSTTQMRSKGGRRVFVSEEYGGAWGVRVWLGATWKVALPLRQWLGLHTPAKALSSTDLPDTPHTDTVKTRSQRPLMP